MYQMFVICLLVGCSPTPPCTIIDQDLKISGDNAERLECVGMMKCWWDGRDTPARYAWRSLCVDRKCNALVFAADPEANYSGYVPTRPEEEFTQSLCFMDVEERAGYLSDMAWRLEQHHRYFGKQAI